MAHNQEMLAHNGKTWGDKVRIIGISIDDSSATVVKHVNTKKWTDVEHYHRGASGSDNDYGVKGVPHVVLIDTHGKIAYIGHPASRELEKDIGTLLKGEKLAGIAMGDDSAEDEDEDQGNFKAMDMAKVDSEVADFDKNVSELAKNSVVTTNGKGL